jgi:uncharacterized damage-inducible protein DinB
LHLISVDDSWFSGLQGAEIPEPLDPAACGDMDSIRQTWDAVENRIRAYLDTLDDAVLSSRPLEGEDQELFVWQVLCSTWSTTAQTTAPRS